MAAAIFVFAVVFLVADSVMPWHQGTTVCEWDVCVTTVYKDSLRSLVIGAAAGAMAYLFLWIGSDRLRETARADDRLASPTNSYQFRRNWVDWHAHCNSR